MGKHLTSEEIVKEAKQARKFLEMVLELNELTELEENSINITVEFLKEFKK